MEALGDKTTVKILKCIGGKLKNTLFTAHKSFHTQLLWRGFAVEKIIIKRESQNGPLF